MDSLTSFLMDQHGAEMSLDALTDSMLANLPHVPGTFDAAAAIVPFATDFSTSTGDMTKRCHICGLFVTAAPRLPAGFI